jgi:DNA-binding NarL/FixJ family response regulator
MNEGEDPIRVVIVDDHPIWRDGLRADLERTGSATVVGEAGDGAEAIDVVREAMPDVVVMDLHLPTVGGVDATRRILDEAPHVKILMLSVSEERDDVVGGLQAGAAGYMLKSATAAEVADAVVRTSRGETVISQRVAGFVLEEMRRQGGGEPGEPRLTTRENEILKLVAKGLTYPEIAARLYISTKTVQNHVQNILSKLQLHRRYELMRYAIQRGLDRP